MALLYRRNPLACPSGVVPGINPTHPAAKALRFSGIASQSNFLNLTAGTVGVRSGSDPSYAIDRVIGPSYIPGTTGTPKSSFSGQSTVADARVTFAAIINLGTPTTIQILFHSSSAGANAQGYLFLINTVLGYQGNNASTSSALAPVAGVPYFVIVSTDGVGTNYLMRRLDTGQVSTEVGSAVGTSGAPNGTYIVGNYSSGDGPTFGKMAAAMFAANYLSLPEMRAWAQDPWSFWFPQPAMSKIAVPAAGGSFLAAWAMNSNLPVIGTGTY